MSEVHTLLQLCGCLGSMVTVYGHRLFFGINYQIFQGFEYHDNQTFFFFFLLLLYVLNKPLKIFNIFLSESFGNFTYEMEMFKSEKYEEAHKEYPVAVLANQRIYFQTKVIANDSELVLLVDNCKVTPSDNPKDKEFYTLIENG